MTSAHDAVTVADLLAYPPEAAVEIVEGTIYLSRDGGFDVVDVDALPDDGRRHELVDGVIVLSPAPRRVHQRGAFQLARLLADAAPADLEIIMAPFDVDAGPKSQVEPDILVLPREDRDGPVPPPLLAVEVLSPSNRGHDMLTKRNLYERIRVPSYWLVDPDEPAVTVLELDDAGRYAEVARTSGGASVSVERPYPVTFRPVDLIR
ncbi:MAG: Uma2 family endonuclease [Streptosporangiales bacterium]